MKLTLAMYLLAQPIECGTWPGLSPTLEEAVAKEGRYAHDAILLLETEDPDEAERVFAEGTRQLDNYQVFPPQRMRALICSESGVVQEGATIVQQIRMGLFAFEAAVRVTERTEENNPEGKAVGFQYATLDGHPEMGIAGFTLRRRFFLAFGARCSGSFPFFFVFFSPRLRSSWPAV